MKRLAVVGLALASGACHGDHAATQITTPPDTVATTTLVSFAGGTITAKIAATAAARDTGLMNVTTLGADAGMLFIFGEDHDSTTVAFWMKDTPIPLSIAFINDSMQVVNVADMAPEDSLTLHKPAKPIRYALEVNQGWFTAHGVTAGAIATFSIPAGTVIDP